ncbi:MarR family winged helix-turn-helix transcriptional regulator [Yoonia sp.]|jgi:MarR family transcriptional regulator, lower aerobic nicotinate degradation pathway regulator|uniref:MarR family winged helix-turn-helix transcriptional regulator n=1 Tax=Yoonia sp. TaxID=2212373 RepID=UPI0040481C95|nr:MarR family transcriptional regulator [Pseudomonadota bacterium]
MENRRKYVLDDQFGYLLRRVTQRHLAIFNEAIPEVTTTQVAVIACLVELGPLSQNLLGRETAMDASTVKGVVYRLACQGLVATTPDPEDRRRLTVTLTPEGAALYESRLATAFDISDKTLAPLSGKICLDRPFVKTGPGPKLTFKDHFFPVEYCKQPVAFA